MELMKRYSFSERNPVDGLHVFKGWTREAHPQPVLIHLFPQTTEMTAAAQQLTQLLSALSAEVRAMVLESGEGEGGGYFVTKPLPGDLPLRKWFYEQGEQAGLKALPVFSWETISRLRVLRSALVVESPQVAFDRPQSGQITPPPPPTAPRPGKAASQPPVTAQPAPRLHAPSHPPEVQSTPAGTPSSDSSAWFRSLYSESEPSQTTAPPAQPLPVREQSTHGEGNNPAEPVQASGASQLFRSIYGDVSGPTQPLHPPPPAARPPQPHSPAPAPESTSPPSTASQFFRAVYDETGNQPKVPTPEAPRLSVAPPPSEPPPTSQGQPSGASQFYKAIYGTNQTAPFSSPPSNWPEPPQPVDPPPVSLPPFKPPAPERKPDLVEQLYGGGHPLQVPDLPTRTAPLLNSEPTGALQGEPDSVWTFIAGPQPRPGGTSAPPVGANPSNELAGMPDFQPPPMRTVPEVTGPGFGMQPAAPWTNTTSASPGLQPPPIAIHQPVGMPPPSPFEPHPNATPAVPGSNPFSEISAPLQVRRTAPPPQPIQSPPPTRPSAPTTTRKAPGLDVKTILLVVVGLVVLVGVVIALVELTS